MPSPVLQRPGDIIATACRPRAWSLLCHSLRAWQRWAALVEYQRGGRGYPPPCWTFSHVGIVLDSPWVVFEIAWPEARFTRIERFVKGKDWRVLRRQIQNRDLVYPDAALDHMKAAAVNLMQSDWRFYDPGQLLNHVVLDLFGVAMDRWPRYTDLGAGFKVCSAGAAFVLERARRAMIDKVGDPGLGLVGDPAFGIDGARRAGAEDGGTIYVAEPWPRAFRIGSSRRFVHTERVKPADFVYHRDFVTLEEGSAS